jgi:ribosome-associated protein
MGYSWVIPTIGIATKTLKMEFELQGQDHITLNNLLKVLHLVGTGGEANIRISNGEVRVNGAVEMQKRKKLRAGDKVTFAKTDITIR